MGIHDEVRARDGHSFSANLESLTLSKGPTNCLEGMLCRQFKFFVQQKLLYVCYFFMNLYTIIILSHIIHACVHVFLHVHVSLHDSDMELDPLY